MSKSDTEIENMDKQMILEIIQNLKGQPGALLPILHNIQLLKGFVPDMAVPIIAVELNISRADVHGVVSFYHYFRKSKPGKYVIQVCRAESCQSMGSVALEQHVKNKLKINYHETSSDENFSLEPVYCLGNCACSPSIAINDKVVGDMNARKFNEVLKSLHKEISTKPTKPTKPVSTSPEWVGV